MEEDLLDLLSFFDGHPPTGEAKEPVTAQSTRSDVSVVLVWFRRPEGSLGRLVFSPSGKASSLCSEVSEVGR